MTKFPLVVPVGDILGSDRPASIRGWVMVPDLHRWDKRSLMYCAAGGGCSTSYFDLQVEGFDGYSMAHYFANRGTVVVAFDHPGIGDSDPVADPFALTPSLVARCHDRALREVRDAFGSGMLAPGLRAVREPKVVGLGHSMGGLIAVVQQGLCRSFDALVVLGHSGLGLPEILTRAELDLTTEPHDLLELEPHIEQLARIRFSSASDVPRRQPARGAFFADDVPQVARHAFARQAVPLLFTCGLASMIPRSADAQTGDVDVPVFLAFGDQDLVADRYGAIALYRSASDATVYLLKASGHCHNQASTRAQLWRRVHDWIDHVAVGRGTGTG